MDREKINKRFGVTEEQLDKEAKEYEDGSWDAPLGKLIIGRPSIANEEVKPITIRLPVSKISAIDKAASSQGRTRSAIKRDAVDNFLAHASA